jgi:SAM-dependent methyltransferase
MSSVGIGMDAAPQRTRVCPVCSSSRIVPFMTVTDNGHLRSLDIKLPVYRCRACDVFFLNPPPPAEIGREYFAEAYAGDGSKNIYYNDEFKDRTSRVRLELLSKQAPPGRRLLDVGCGKGQFVRVARSEGWDAWGVELDAGACAYAKDTLGLDTVLNGSLDHSDLPAQFDVVTLWDVIEHVPDPVDIFRQALRRLRPGGIVAVRTANIRSWGFDRHRSRWWAFGSDHRFYFSPHSLGVAMNRAGLTVAAVVNGESAERPDKRPSRDIADTSFSEGFRSVSKSPAKIAKLGRYGVNLVRRIIGDWRYGSHYRMSLRTVYAVNNQQPHD